MTQVDFYILDGADSAARLDFVCRLAEKASGSGNRVYLHAADAAQAEALDALLWSFRDDSFVAHQLVGGSDDSHAPVLLGHAHEPAAEREVLINLAAEVPPFFSRFERTLEVISDDPALRESGRARYSYYKDRGYPLRHHRMAGDGRAASQSGE
jgi:DNA polymerase-3 subunit chi